jgi:hypothetical protein
VIALLVSVALLQQGSCDGQAAAALTTAASRVELLDLAGAAQQYAAAAAAGCAAAEVPAHYLQGLVAARSAYREGGSPESLAPVRDAVAALDARGGTLPGAAQVARFVLLAAAAAAQSERDEMALLLDHALRLERLQRAAGQPGAPAVSALEAAGDLWLQVHRYDDARRAYLEAETQVGARPRLSLGLARVAARLQDRPAACAAYARLAAAWGGRGEAPELAEARTFLAACPQ